ncbi:MAG: flagellar biosynthesis anti-sigma factor FlgM [Vicinamibacterales bacterium]
MKVDSTTSHQSTAAQQIDPNRDKETAKAQRQVRSGSDQVEISTEAALLAEALRVAESAPDVREALVEQMRERLGNGNVGDDVVRLADSMIDRLLEQ